MKLLIFCGVSVFRAYKHHQTTGITNMRCLSKDQLQTRALTHGSATWIANVHSNEFNSVYHKFRDPALGKRNYRSEPFLVDNQQVHLTINTQILRNASDLSRVDLYAVKKNGYMDVVYAASSGDIASKIELDAYKMTTEVYAVAFFICALLF